MVLHLVKMRCQLVRRRHEYSPVSDYVYPAKPSETWSERLGALIDGDLNMAEHLILLQRGRARDGCDSCRARVEIAQIAGWAVSCEKPHLARADSRLRPSIS
jgi:hypothetical protein